MSTLKQCPRGHFYEGDVCPYCPTQYYPKSGHTHPTRTDGSNQHTPTFYPTETLTTIAAGTNIPLCPHCGRPLRREIPRSNFPVIGSIEGHAYDGKVPWNYLWDGKCENCGHDFSITMTQKIYKPEKDRYTTVKVSARRVERMTSDDLIGLSGVEIEQHNSIDGVKKTFISTNELNYLINALKNSPILKQLDWNEDRT